MSDILGIYYNGICAYNLIPGAVADDKTVIPDKKLSNQLSINGVTLDIYPGHHLVLNGSRTDMQPGGRYTAVIVLENNGVISHRQLRKGEVLTCHRGVWSILHRTAFNALAQQAAA